MPLNQTNFVQMYASFQGKKGIQIALKWKTYNLRTSYCRTSHHFYDLAVQRRANTMIHLIPHSITLNTKHLLTFNLFSIFDFNTEFILTNQKLYKTIYI